MTTVRATTRNHLRHVVEALQEDFEHKRPDEIELAVARSVDELDPHFEDFIPVLVMRRSRQKLALGDVGSPASTARAG